MEAGKRSRTGYLYCGARLLAALGLLWSLSAGALDQDRRLAEFHHTAWTLKDGAPPDIWALAQSADGFLWLGTGTGLYRFDGLRFDRQALPLRSNDITALQSMPDGSLWIGFFFGGASRLKDGQLVDYTEHDGVAPGVVYDFARSRDGALWMASDGGLSRYAGGHWETVGGDWNYPEAGAKWVYVDKHGVLWALTGRTLVFLRPGAHRFEHTGERAGVAVLAQGPDGGLWLSDSLGGTRELPDYAAGNGMPTRGDPLPADQRVYAKRLLFDRDGGLWATDVQRGGVFRVPHRGGISTPLRGLRGNEIQQRFQHQQGLTADIAVPILEDHEGSIWVGTNLGLNRFRSNTFVTEARIPTSSPLGYTLAAGRDGAVWVGVASQLSRLSGRTRQHFAMPLSRIGTLYCDADDSLWMGGQGALLHRVGQRLQRFAAPPEAGDAMINAIASDRDGGLWVSFIGAGTYRFADGRWIAHGGPGELPAATVVATATDADNEVWFGYPDSQVLRLGSDGALHFGPAQGLDIGNVMTINADGRPLLVGGEFGIAALAGGRFHSLRADRIAAFSGVSGIARARDGSLWLNGIAGVVRIAGDELQRALDDPAYTPRYRLFDFEDGLPGVALQAANGPTAIAAGDGRLWFATNHGVAWVDPARIARNPLPPPVSILGLSAGGNHYPPLSGLELPARTTSLRINYSGLSLAIPERARFRYRMDGVDGNWQDAGSRREAVYTNLDPGPHRFSVIAANDDGVWNSRGAELNFSIRPTYYQTWPFRMLMLLLAIGLVCMTYLLRLRQLSLRLRARLGERMEERERIARELHDTLLQSVHGLTLYVQAAVDQLPPGEPARATMERALDRADQVIAEGRDRVSELRAAADDVPELSQALAGVGRELAQDEQAITFRMLMIGDVRPLDVIVRDEAYRIGREALLNAFHHAQAQQIEAELTYGVHELRLRIRDDGCGIDAAVLQAGSAPGHWGLTGMRERAQKIGARLTLWSRPRAGTELDLRIPASVAYRELSGSSLWRWLRYVVGGGR